MAGTGHEAVGIPLFDHHRAEVGEVIHLLARLFEGDAFLLAQLSEVLRVLFMLVRGDRVDNLSAVDLDLVRIAEDNELCEALLDDLFGCLDGTGIFTLRKNDGLQIALRLFLHLVKKLAQINLLCCADYTINLNT